MTRVGRLVVALDGLGSHLDALLGTERPLVHAADAVAAEGAGEYGDDQGEDAVDEAHLSASPWLVMTRSAALPTVSSSRPQP